MLDLHYLLSIFERDTLYLLTVWAGLEEGSKTWVSGDWRADALPQNIFPKSASSCQGQQVTQQTVYLIHIGASPSSVFLPFPRLPQGYFHKGTSTGVTLMASLCLFPTFPRGRITARMSKHGRKSGACSANLFSVFFFRFPSHRDLQSWSACA